MFSMYAYNIKETQTALGDPRKYGARSMFDAIYCIVFSTFTPLTEVHHYEDDNSVSYVVC